ncbi:MAG: transglutaminase-like domain-containing protein [Planctomycetota bacterium]|jgi:transglutaminase-like putative cysteine protease
MSGRGSSPYLAPGRFVDSDAPAVIAYAERAIAGARDEIERARRLYHAVRDDIDYTPYVNFDRPKSYRASCVLEAGRGFCVPKAALLAAAARVAGIESRLFFADVRNHLATPKLLRRLGTDLFAWHGGVELRLGGKWVKATPAFNLSLCERFGVRALDFDGRHDSLLQPYDRRSRRHMEYVRMRGALADVPFERIRADFRARYPRVFDDPEAFARGDFAGEVPPPPRS